MFPIKIREICADSDDGLINEIERVEKKDPSIFRPSAGGSTRNLAAENDSRLFVLSKTR